MHQVQTYVVTASDLLFGGFLLLIAFGIFWWAVTSAVEEGLTFWREWHEDRRIARERDNCLM